MAALERNSLGRVHFDEIGLCDGEVSDGRCLGASCVRARSSSNPASNRARRANSSGPWKLCAWYTGRSAEFPSWRQHHVMTDFTFLDGMIDLLIFRSCNGRLPVAFKSRLNQF